MPNRVFFFFFLKDLVTSFDSAWSTSELVCDNILSHHQFGLPFVTNWCVGISYLPLLLYASFGNESICGTPRCMLFFLTFGERITKSLEGSRGL